MTIDAPSINFETAMLKGSEARNTAKLDRLGQVGKSLDLEKIEEASVEFEAVFLAEMLKPMFAGLKPNPMFGGGSGEETFQGMMVQEYGNAMARAGGVGLAEHVRAELIRIQEILNQENQPGG